MHMITVYKSKCVSIGIYIYYIILYIYMYVLKKIDRCASICKGRTNIATLTIEAFDNLIKIVRLSFTYNTCFGIV